MRFLRLTRRDTRGAALIEAALVTPLLIVLAFGVLDVGRAFYTQIQMNDVAQEGVVYGAYSPGDVAAVQERVVGSATNLSITTSDVTVTCPLWPEAIKVSVTTNLKSISPFFFGKTFTLTASQEADLLTDDVACVASS